MPVRVVLTQNLQRHLEVPPLEAEGATVREVLEVLFTRHPRARSYLLDDQGGLRHHVTVFVDGRQLQDRRGLSDSVSAGGELYVMQALSGG